MPDLPNFLAGFDLVKGKVFNGYRVENVQASHETVKQYQEYKYPITLTLSREDGRKARDTIPSSLKEELGKEHIIYGVRNPYRCWIEIQSIESNGSQLVIKLMGRSRRA